MRAGVLSSMKVEIYSRMALVELTDTQEDAILTHRGATCGPTSISTIA
jgi:hypothetical protein